MLSLLDVDIFAGVVSEMVMATILMLGLNSANIRAFLSVAIAENCGISTVFVEAASL